MDDFAVKGRFARLVTPIRDFYRIDIAQSPPQVDPSTWRLQITRDGKKLRTLTYDELLALSLHQADVTIGCVSNEIGGDLVGTARWQGVLLADLLRSVGVTSAGRVSGTSVDGFQVSFAAKYAFDGRPSMVAVGMNDEVLPVLHGFPARLVVPGPLRVHVGDQVAGDHRRLRSHRPSGLLGQAWLGAGAGGPHHEPDRQPSVDVRRTDDPGRSRVGADRRRGVGGGAHRRRPLAPRDAVPADRGSAVAAVGAPVEPLARRVPIDRPRHRRERQAAGDEAGSRLPVRRHRPPHRDRDSYLILAILVAMAAAEHLPLADVKNRLSEVVEQVEREHGRVVITKHGRPAAVVMSLYELEGLEETLEILSDPEEMAAIRRGEAELARGQGVELTKEEALALIRRPSA